MFLTNLSGHDTQPPRFASCVPGPRQIETAGLMADILNRGATLRIKATGKSMHPLVRDGDIVILVKRPSPSLRTGDLVMARSDAGSAVLHRIVKKSRGRHGRFVFKTQGDALMVGDKAVTEENILAKAIVIERTGASPRTKKVDLESIRWKVAGFAMALSRRFWGRLYYACYLPAKHLLAR